MKHCPICNTDENHGFVEGEYVDIGVGYQKCSPDFCQVCEYSENYITKIEYQKDCWERQFKITKQEIPTLFEHFI